MDVLRLDIPTYIPDEIIEGYSSMIWTERFVEPGDFEMKTSFVAETRELIPEGSFITLRDTQEVMMVLTHSIGKDSNGFSELTVTGTSVDAFFKERNVVGVYGKKYSMSRPYTAAEAACVIMWNSVVNTTAEDVTRLALTRRSSLDACSNVAVTNSATYVGTSKRRWLENGTAYDPIIRFLNQGRMGIRMIRPNSSSTKVVKVTTDDKGIISYVTDNNITQMRFDIYNGVDRRISQNARDVVAFSYDQGHIDDPSYLYSIADYKTNVYVTSSVGNVESARDGVTPDTAPRGFNRRLSLVSGGDPEEGESKPDFLADLPDVGDDELNNHEKVKIADGKISQLAPYVYKTDYNLGDLVTMVGEYKFNETMRVTEYIRTEDSSGDYGYPALVVV